MLKPQKYRDVSLLYLYYPIFPSGKAGSHLLHRRFNGAHHGVRSRRWSAAAAAARKTWPAIGPRQLGCQLD